MSGPVQKGMIRRHRSGVRKWVRMTETQVSVEEMRRGVEDACRQGEEEGISATAAVQAVHEELRREQKEAGHWSAAAAEVWEGDMRVALGLALEWYGRRFPREVVMAMKDDEVTMSRWEQGEETGEPWQEQCNASPTW